VKRQHGPPSQAHRLLLEVPHEGGGFGYFTLALVLMALDAIPGVT